MAMEPKPLLNSEEKEMLHEAITSHLATLHRKANDVKTPTGVRLLYKQQREKLATLASKLDL